MKLQCNECGGTYDTVQRDSITYFHACSPEEITTRAVEVAGKITVPEVRTPRATPRDENPKVDATGKVVGIKADGKGVTPI